MVVHRRIDCLKYNQVIAAQKHPYANKKKKKNIKTIFFYSSQATFCTNTQLWNVYFHLKTIQIAVPVTSNAWLVFLWYRTQKTLKHPHLSQYLQTPQASRRGGKTWFKKAEPFRRRRKKNKQKKNKNKGFETPWERCCWADMMLCYGGTDKGWLSNFGQSNKIKWKKDHWTVWHRLKDDMNASVIEISFWILLPLAEVL